MNTDNQEVQEIKATVTNATVIGCVQQATPPPVDPVQIIDNAIGAVSDVINSFSDKVPNEEQKQKEEAKSGIDSFMDFIKSDKFSKDINNTAKKFNIPPKKLAENFFEKALGTIGDILGIAISTVGNASHALIKLLSVVLNSSVDILVKVSNALVSIVTLNKTCQA